MAHQVDWITVFRSADNSAEAEAAELRTRLSEAGIDAIALGDDAPGVVVGTWEVRVPEADREKAEKIVGTPLPEPEDETDVPEEDITPDLDFVTVFSGQGAEAEMEAVSIQSLLDANGIPTVVIGSAQIPSLPFEVRVPKSRREEAVSLLEPANESES